MEEAAAAPAAEDAPKLLKVNLGCGRKPKAGYVNVDVRQIDGVDLVANLEHRWPWENDTVDEFFSEDFVEHVRQWWEEPDPAYMEQAVSYIQQGHLPQAVVSLMNAIGHPKRTYGVIHVMNEAWRCLKPMGLLRLRVPSTDGRGAWQDPTHVSYWNRNSTLYFIDNDIRSANPDIVALFKHERTSQYLSSCEGLGIVWEEVVMSKPA